MNSRVVLLPGEWYFGSSARQVRTLLGSCVAVTLWHPERRLGGMCHFVLPTRGQGAELDGRYGDEALTMLMRRVAQVGTKPKEYVAGIFGGGDMFPEAWSVFSPNIGAQNAALAQQVVRSAGFSVAQQDVGATRFRRIVLDLFDGSLHVTATDINRTGASEPSRMGR